MSARDDLVPFLDIAERILRIERLTACGHKEFFASELIPLLPEDDLVSLVQGSIKRLLSLIILTKPRLLKPSVVS